MATRPYTVKRGESLSSIARDQLNELPRWTEIAYINSISEPYTIYPGQTILLPVDTGGLQVEITRGTSPTIYGPPAPPGGAAITKSAGFEFTPANLAIAGVIAVAVFLLFKDAD